MEAIVYNYNNKNNKNQVKETFPTWSQNWFFPASSHHEPQPSLLPKCPVILAFLCSSNRQLSSHLGYFAHAVPFV